MKKFGLIALALAVTIGFANPSQALVEVTLQQQGSGSELWDVILNSDVALGDGIFGIEQGPGGALSFTPNSTDPAPFGTCALPPGNIVGNICSPTTQADQPGVPELSDTAIYLLIAGGTDSAGFTIGLIPNQLLGVLTVPGGALGLGDPGLGAVTLAGVAQLQGTTPEWGTFASFGTVREAGTYVTNGEVIPEPSTVVLLGAGLAGLAFLRRRTD